MFSKLLILAAFILHIAYGDATVASSTPNRTFSRPCPLQRCENCPSSAQLVAPGIGFALEMGTAAIRWHNGTLQPIAHVTGSSEYLELMATLSSTTPEIRFPHDIPSTVGKVRCVLERLQRTINKFLGRPENRKTAILAEMLALLKKSVETTLPANTQVTHAVVTTPDGMCLVDWEVNDVLDYLHIKNLMEAPDRLYSISAAFAGMGHGLCKHYTQPYRCEVEDHLDFSYQNVLNVDFSDEALCMTTKRMQTYKVFGCGESVVDTELGYVEELGDEEMDKLFQRIGNKMRDFVRSQRRQPAMILLTGTRVAEQRFKATLRDALVDIVATDVVRHISGTSDAGIDVNPVFTIAKGAAEVAKRRLEAPVRCLWRENCQALKLREDIKNSKENSEL